MGIVGVQPIAHQKVFLRPSNLSEFKGNDSAEALGLRAWGEVEGCKVLRFRL